MAAFDVEDGDVPWGKYTYALEGLATRCYLEGAADLSTTPRPGAPSGKRLRFRVELPSRCFVLSVAVKLPHVPECVLPALQDIAIERTLSDGNYETVYDGYIANSLKPVDDVASVTDKTDDAKPPKDDHDSPTAVDATEPIEESKPSEEPPPRKKVMEVRRAADSLRLTITDMDDRPKSTSFSQRRRRSTDSDEASDSGDLRTLGIVVVGYVRGQTPASNRIKILLNSSARLGLHNAMADKAEVDGLLGLAFLSNRRYRQAAELLQRASELTVQVATADAKSGCAVDDALTWAAELNLLSAHAYFEHMPMSNDGIVRLVQVASTAKVGKRGNASPRDVRDLETGFLDLRTELLSMLEGLLTVLVKFLSESNSLAVKMASSRMIEFVSGQLGCAIARHMAAILNQVLRLYPTCTTFGARERAAASSFSYDSMEDCFKRLIDICCRLFPLTEHSVLRDLFDNTLIPVFMDAFQESEYLCFDADADVEEVADELMTTAVAQALRVIYLTLGILGVDGNVPTALTTRVLNMLIARNGSPRTPVLLRRTALHTWDSIARALKQAAFGSTATSFSAHIKMLRDSIPKLLVDVARPGFEYDELDDESDTELEIFKEEYLVPENSQALKEVLMKRRRRTEIVDRHTLGRLLSLIYQVCNALEQSEDDEGGVNMIISLQDVLARAIADLLMSSLIDVSYHQAAVSGNGSQESNNMYEFGDIKTQLKVVSEVLEELFESYWAALSLLPTATAVDCVRNAPIRAVLGWCVDRMGHSAPPRGMLQLLYVGIRGLQHELNTPMYKLPAVPDSAHEVTFISIYRAHLRWFPQAVYEEAFDVMDILNEAVAQDLMAKDLALLIEALGDQAEKFQARTDASLELLASIVASSVPKRMDLAMSSLRALVDPSLGIQRISNGFPKSNRSNTGSFTRRLQFTSSVPKPTKADPMAKSLYIHVVLASCFDKFDALGRAAKRRGGPSYMGEKIDAFVEHAALSVRCLHACARARTHREYVAAILGDIFSTCLAMQDHGDGRVRLAGFEIFAASLDVLFLAQKAMVLVPSQPSNSRSEASVLGVGSVPNDGGGVVEAVESVNGVAECPSGERALPGTAGAQPLERSDSGVLTSLNSGSKVDDTKEAMSHIADGELEAAMDRRMQEIYAEGGSCYFHAEQASPSQLVFEERGWQMLCAFVTSSLGIGKYVDFVVQRACLEYLKGCMLNALRGRSTGASVIAFEHIELLWDAVNRLVGSPWRTLNALALWVICAITNVAMYSSIIAKGRGAARQRTAQLNEFVLKEVFPRAEELLKSRTRETRVWGMQLLEAYIRARNMNNNVAQVVPSPPGRLLRCLDNLKHDWDDEVRERSQSLLETHFNSLNKKTSQVHSFTSQAQNFMSIKRHNDDGFDGADSKIELWFPALPKQMLVSQMEMYCRTLEAFANSEIEGGEETDLIGEDEEKEEGDEAYHGVYEDEEEGYEFEDEREEGQEGVEDDEMGTEMRIEGENSDEEVVGDDETVVKMGDLEDFGGSEESSEDADDRQEETGGNVDLTSIGTADIEDSMNAVAAIPKTASAVGDVKPEAQAEDDIIEDDEFPAPKADGTTTAPDPSVVTQVSDGEDDDFGGTRVGSSDDDVDEEEEVIDVTDEPDVLIDVDIVNKEKPWTGTEAERRTAVSRLSLNPDLDEGVTVLRRKGSFTSRASSGLPVWEGDAPRLARRRSQEVSSLASIIVEGGVEEGEAWLRRRASRGGGSPRVEGGREEGEVGRIGRRRSFKGMLPGLERGGVEERGREDGEGRRGVGRGRDDVGGGKMGRGSRGKEEEKEKGEEKRWGGRANRRSLPRAPAFVQGGGAGRRGGKKMDRGAQRFSKRGVELGSLSFGEDDIDFDEEDGDEIKMRKGIRVGTPTADAFRGFGEDEEKEKEKERRGRLSS